MSTENKEKTEFQKYSGKLYEMLTEEEKAFHNALVAIAGQYGPFDLGTSSIWVGYETSEQNEDAKIGVKCSNCSFYNPENNGCALVSYKVDPNGKCRLAAIPDGMVNTEMKDDEDSMEDMDKKYTGCGCPTCKSMDVACKDCPVCSPEMGKEYSGCGCASCKGLNLACKDCPSCSPDMDKVIDAEGFSEGSLEKDSPCWEGYVQRGTKPGKGGGMVPNCVPAQKANDIDKAKEVSVGDHVTFGVPKPPDKTEYAHGVVERVSRSGKVTVSGTNESIEATDANPVAVVRVWSIGASGKLSRTDRSVAKPFSSLRVLTTPIEETTVNVEKVSKSLDSRLSELAENYNKNKEGDKRITVGALRQVYNRGIGAYRTNPSSVRGTVSSAEQWAMGRVNAFMAGLRGRFPRKAFDLDLFPKGHPRSTKKSDWAGSAFGPTGSINKSNNISLFSETKRNDSQGWK